ncbi:hypothetical protein, partial [Nocardia brasiliensis]|uniref:ATP-binding protein n=1 Tax=Nocardia brasiliensis TaxID=37326 RepID=UPI0024558808
MSAGARSNTSRDHSSGVSRDPALLDETYERCRAEASAGLGDDTVYAEALISAARHIEVQVVADG